MTSAHSRLVLATVLFATTAFAGRPPPHHGAPAPAGAPASAEAQGSSEPRYSTVNLTPEVVFKHPDAELARQFVDFAKKFSVTEMKRLAPNPKTVWAAADPASDAVPEMSRTERIAMLSLLQRAGMQGAESDMLVEQPDKTLVPVTIIWEPSGVISYRVGKAVKDLFDPAVTPQQIREKFGVGEFEEEGTKWAAGEYSAVQQALALLTPEELALAKDFGFRRLTSVSQEMSRKVPSAATTAAFYHRSDNGVSIDCFDLLFAGRRTAFIGDPDAPIPDAVRTLLHEIGHAISDAQGRALALAGNAAVDASKAAKAKNEASPSDEAHKDWVEKNAIAVPLRNASITADKAEMMAHGRLVEELEFAKILPPSKSVTTYGRTNVTENFAEAFWMFKGDPDALKRISPAAAEWFAAGNHTKLAALPLEVSDKKHHR